MSDPHARPWYVDTFDDTYVSRYAHRNDDEAAQAVDTLVRFGAVGPNRRVLDLCCGAGRHLAALRNRGIRAIGLDLSPQLLARARASTPQGPPLIRGDMRYLPARSGQFHSVIQMFTAFGYFAEDAENRAVLHETARVLRPDGHYSLDVFNPRFVMAAGTGRTERDLADGSHVIEDRVVDPVRRRVEKTTTIFHSSNGERAGQTERRFESVRLFERAELEQWLTDSGFAVERVLGDYSGAPHDPAVSPRLWLLARRLG